jgi:hypothetical protein
LMRPCAFLEAFGPTCLAGGERERVLMQIPQKRVTKLIDHHKVAAFPPQPQVQHAFDPCG